MFQKIKKIMFKKKEKKVLKIIINHTGLIVDDS